ncbi:MAG: LodA/GoxA family CTQ-dependent oxidase, partial [Blastocatellia bacterium]
MATKFKIHPAIGIARVGDSTSGFYLAPESPGALPIACDQSGNTTVGTDGTEAVISDFKDSNGAVYRQGARFRVYVYDDATPAGREVKVGDQLKFVNPKNGQTITGSVANIRWTVYLANKKTNWYEFQQLEGEHGYSDSHPLRNASITDVGDRQRLIIDPGPQSISYTNPNDAPGNPNLNIAQFAQGQNPDSAQTFPPELNPLSITTLGEIMATQQSVKQAVKQGGSAGTYNRLVVLGGYGNSGSMNSGFGQPSIQTYANNDGWFDDLSDGPVLAQIVYNVLKQDPK